MTASKHTIWTYWDQGAEAAPDPISACLRSVREKNPEFNFEVLDRKNLHQLLTADELRELPSRPLVLRSDRLRLLLLKRFGGIWVDPTVYMWQGLNAWLPSIENHNLITFQGSDSSRRIEPWFLAAQQGSPLIDSVLRAHTRFFERPRIHKPRRVWWKIQKSLSSLEHQQYTSLLWLFPPLRWLPIYPYFAISYMFTREILFPQRTKSEGKISLFPSEPALRLFHLARSLNGVTDLNFIAQQADSATQDPQEPLSKTSFHLGNPLFWKKFSDSTPEMSN